MGASVVAVACATYGLVSGSLMGGPIARAKIKKYNLHSMVNEGEEYGESVETAQSPSQAKDLGVDSICLLYTSVLWNVLSQQTIGIFVCTSFPGGMRMGKIEDCVWNYFCNVGMMGKLRCV